MNIGVLALQGAFKEHIEKLDKLGYKGVEVRTIKELENVQALILPGGESTAIGKLLVDFCLKDLVIKKVEEGMCVWGTCAGMILLAKELSDSEEPHLKLLDIKVKRNGYGRQLGSFNILSDFKGISGKVPMVFVRAPYIEKVGEEVEVLAVVEKKIVGARKGNILVTSFHPELTEDDSVHKYFINMSMEGIKKRR